MVRSSDSIPAPAPVFVFVFVPVFAVQMPSRQILGEGTGTEGEQSGEKSCTVHPVRSMSEGRRPKPGKE